MVIRAGHRTAKPAEISQGEYAISRRALSVCLLLTAIARFPAIAETPSEIVAKAAQNMLKADRQRDNYTYEEIIETRELDEHGKVKQSETATKEVMVFAGEQVERTTAKNGHALAEREAKKEQQKVDRAAAEAGKLTPEQVKERLDKRDREFAKTNGWLTELPDAFKFTVLREEALNGGDVYVIHGVPDPAYDGKDSHLFHCVAGDLYIDKQSYTLVKMNGVFLQNCSFGLFLAKVDEGSKIDYQRTFVNGEVWLPKQVTITGEGRAVFKKFNTEVNITYSGYRKFSTESRIVSTSAAP